MKLISQLCFCFAISFLTACSKGELTTLEGRVLQAGTGNPLVDARVRIMDGVGTSSSFSGSTSSRGEAISFTDSNGYFKVELEATGDVWFSVRNGTDEVYSNERRLENMMGSLMSYPRGQHTKDILVEMYNSGILKIKLLNEINLPDTTVRIIKYKEYYNHKVYHFDDYSFVHRDDIFNIYHPGHFNVPYTIEYYVDDIHKIIYDTVYVLPDERIERTYVYER